jgi:hypothetical protein
MLAVSLFKRTYPMSDSSIPDFPAQPDSDAQAQYALLRAFVATVQHFFGGFPQLFAGVTDPRHPALITYSLVTLLFTGMLMFACRLGARRQINHWFRGNQRSAAKFQALFRVETCPHGDTLNAAFSRLNPAELQAVVTGLTQTLIRRKVLYPYRLLGVHFLVVMDGTGVLVFSERHCPHCLTCTRDGQTLYYHPILEAKLVTRNGWALSLMTEFIENPGEHPTKQDCELKAFYRLADRLKQRFPRLPICLLLDGLFAGGPTFGLCHRYGWKYLIVLQEDDLPSVHREFEALLPLAPENHREVSQRFPSLVHQAFRWANDIAYTDSDHREHTLSVIECLETSSIDGQLHTTRFKWVSNFTVTAKNVTALSNEGGRLRWKIENEGFNVQKNGGYALEHPYSQNVTAAKIFYFLLQIAHLLSQLVELGSLFRRAFPTGVGSAKNLALRLLEAWRNLPLPLTEFNSLYAGRFQIRFDSS